MSYTPLTDADYAIAHAINNEDIASLRNANEWLTLNAIHLTVLEHFNTTTTRIAYVDPLWFQEWILSMDQNIPRPDPTFFTNHMSNGRRPIGLAMPMHVSGNHYITIYMNLEANGAVVFDSMGGRNEYVSDGIVTVLDRFHTLFEKFFARGVGHFRVMKGRQVAQQTDGSSCGIYTVRNTLDLIDHRIPSMVALSRNEVAHFRRKATAALQLRKLAEDFAYGN